MVSAVSTGTLSPSPAMIARFAGCDTSKRSKGRMPHVEDVKTIRLIEGVASAASRIASLPATACETRSPGAGAIGEAMWMMYEHPLTASK